MSFKILEEHLRVSIPVKEPDAAAPGGWRYREGRYRIELDWTKLQEMARKAARNRRGSSTAGAVRVVIEK